MKGLGIVRTYVRAFPTVTSHGQPSPPLFAATYLSLSVLYRKKLAICCCDVVWKQHCKETTNWNPFPAGGLFPSAPIWSGMREHWRSERTEQISYSLLFGTAALLLQHATSAGAQHYLAFGGTQSAVCTEAVMPGVWQYGDQSSWVYLI